MQCSGPRGNDAPSIVKDTSATVDSVAAKDIKPLADLSYEQRQGKLLFAKYCAICHGSEGKGDGFNAYNLDPKPRDLTDTRAMAGLDRVALYAIVDVGGKGVNKSPLMPGWGGRMNKQEIEYIVTYIEALNPHH
jgi:mono/diheme cytochrome c family protein